MEFPHVCSFPRKQPSKQECNSNSHHVLTHMVTFGSVLTGNSPRMGVLFNTLL